MRRFGWFVGGAMACAAPRSTSPVFELELSPQRKVAEVKPATEPAPQSAADSPSALSSASALGTSAGSPATADDRTDADAVAMSTMSASRPFSARAVAVLLPLTGKHEKWGRIALAAAVWALEPELVVYPLDTEGTPQGAIAAVDRAVASDAAFVLGPLGVVESRAAMARAMTHGIGIGVWGPEDGAEPHNGAFRLATSAADEARVAARLLADAALGEVAVLAPADEAGQAAAGAFAKAARERGLTVIANGSYGNPGRTLQDEVRAFLGLVPSANPRLARHLARFGKRGWKTFSPDVGFSALYIPDNHARAALVASYFPYHNVELRSPDGLNPDYLRRKHHGRIPQTVQLVGDSGWFHPTLPTRGGGAVVGALVVGPCAQPTDESAAWQADFMARTRRASTNTAMMIFDTSRLVKNALLGIDAEPSILRRRQAVKAIYGARLDDATCAPIRLDERGELARDVAIWEVDATGFVPAPW